MKYGIDKARSGGDRSVRITRGPISPMRDNLPEAPRRRGHRPGAAPRGRDYFNRDRKARKAYRRDKSWRSVA